MARLTRRELRDCLSFGGFQVLDVRPIHKRQGVLRSLHHELGLPYEWALTKALSVLPLFCPVWSLATCSWRLPASPPKLADLALSDSRDMRTADIPEINGDNPMPATRRVRYIVRNVLRNFRRSTGPIATKKWRLPHSVLTDSGIRTTSPARVLAEAFIVHELPNLIADRRIRVLDVGCGSGRMSDLLGKAGFAGHYVGVDVQNRFAGARWQGGSFTTEFVEGDAHDLVLQPDFDLIISNSALEHVPDDGRLIARLQTLLAHGGLQVHLVPSTWALFLFLWHGYRQYGRAAIAARFPGQPPLVYWLGGAACFLVHFMLITVPEMLFRQSLRKRFPGFYAAVLRRALRVDHLVPFMPSGCVIICRTARGPA